MTKQEIEKILLEQGSEGVMELMTEQATFWRALCCVLLIFLTCSMFVIAALWE